MTRAATVLLSLMIVTVAVRADVDVSFTRPGGAALDSVERIDSVVGVELRLINRGAGPVTLSAFEFRFDGGDFANGALCATNWSPSPAFNGLSPAWLHVDSTLANCAGNRRVSGVSGAVSLPLDGPLLPPNTSVLVGSFNLAVNAPAQAQTLDLRLAPGSGIDDANASIGGGGIGERGQSVRVRRGRTIDVVLRVVPGSAPTVNEGTPPSSTTDLCAGAVFRLEIWSSQVAGAEGVGRLSVDVGFDPDAVTAGLLIDHAPLFEGPGATGTINAGAGLCDDVGGVAASGAHGVAPGWMLLARVPFTAANPGPATFTLSGGAGAFRVFGAPYDLVLGSEVFLGPSVTVFVTDGGGEDCNNNGLADGCEIADGLVADCNLNGSPDSCDVASGASSDLNLDGRPDECGVVAPCELQKWTALDQSADDRFGTSVAIDGDLAVVGARLDNCTPSGSNCGSAYVFRRRVHTWSQQQRLTASDAKFEDLFGFSVAVSGGTVVVGSRWSNCVGGAADCGAAYVFEHNGSSWVQRAKLIASDAAPGDNLGIAVAIDGDVIVAGASERDCTAGADCGALYVFRRSGNSWVQEDTLTPDDPGAGDHFGEAVAIAGSFIVAAAQYDHCEGGADGCGSAYAFAHEGGDWVQYTKLTATDAAAGDNFGVSVDIENELVVVGAHNDNCANNQSNCGSAYVFRLRGGHGVQEARLRANDAAPLDSFGTSVATNGEIVLIGSRLDDCPGSGQNCGSAYFYRRVGGTWTQFRKLFTADGDDGDLLGVAAAMSDNLALVGAYNDDCAGGGIQCGSAYVFVVEGSDCDGDGNADLCDQVGADFDADGTIDDLDPDVDGDGVANATDSCDFTPPNLPPSSGGRAIDYVGQSCSLSLEEHAQFKGCLNGGGPNGPAASGPCGEHFDYNCDGRIDLADVAWLQRAFAASN